MGALNRLLRVFLGLLLLALVLFRSLTTFLFFRVLFAKGWFFDDGTARFQAFRDFSLMYFLFSYLLGFGIEVLAYLSQKCLGAEKGYSWHQDLILYTIENSCQIFEVISAFHVELFMYIANFRDVCEGRKLVVFDLLLNF